MHLSKFIIGDVVQILNTPEEPGSIFWPTKKEPVIGIVLDIVKTPKSLFSECLLIKIHDGEFLTLSPNMVKKL